MPRRPDTITDARRLIAACAPEQLPALIRRLRGDPRAGVRALADAAAARLARAEAENERLARMMSDQVRLHDLGFTVVAGIDEVGRGALAGPVTACAVVLDRAIVIEGLDDSKRLTPERRSAICEHVRSVSVACAVGDASPAEIDDLGIGRATRLAWQRALDALGIAVDHVLVDGNDAGRLGVPTTSVIKGDARVACIAAASVVAKVTRDLLMEELSVAYPAYGFAENRGYGTEPHLAALRDHGPCEVHRISFAPCFRQESLF